MLDDQLNQGGVRVDGSDTTTTIVRVDKDQGCKPSSTGTSGVGESGGILKAKMGRFDVVDFHAVRGRCVISDGAVCFVILGDFC